jgi:hypothetical protein
LKEKAAQVARVAFSFCGAVVSPRTQRVSSVLASSRESIEPQSSQRRFAKVAMKTCSRQLTEELLFRTMKAGGPKLFSNYAETQVEIFRCDVQNGRGGSMKRTFLFVGWLAVSAVLVGCSSSSTKAPTAEATVNDAVDAYIYGFPLVTMDMTRKQMTNVDSAGPQRAPMGQFVRMRTYPTAEYRDVPGANTDTLYTTVRLDVSKEPWIFNIPDMGDRYYMTPMLDGWTNVFKSPGTRTTGSKPQKYAITGPGWSGTLPQGVTEIKAPTGSVWILGRIYCTGTPEDYAKVHALQDKFSVVPLSSYGKPYTPPPATVDANLDMKTPTRQQIQSLSTEEFFNYLAKLMTTNPPGAQDAPIVARISKIGLVRGQDFDGQQVGRFGQ